MTLAGNFMATFLWFLAAIGPLVFLHELGHYLVGRLCGIKADTFSIGFGREILGWTDKRGTRWKLGWMPLGGYVKFAGDMSAAGGDNDDWKELPEAERNLTFQSKPVWKRALTVAAGPVTNFIVGFLIFAGLVATIGAVRDSNQIGTVIKGSVAESIGIKQGDRIVAINGRETNGFEDIYNYVIMRPGQIMTFSLMRDNQALEVTGAPRTQMIKNPLGGTNRVGKLGVGPAAFERYQPAWSDVPGIAWRQSWGALRVIVDGLGQFVTGQRSVKEIDGPVNMARASGMFANMGWAVFIGFVAIVSINLGFINLLPVPMLDGGHLFFYAVEALRRKPVSLVAQEWAYRVGFLMLMSLMLFVTANDLVKWASQ